MSEKRAKMLLQCISNNNSVELAIGYLRYEALRKVTPKKYQEPYNNNVVNGTWFDDMVDELIEKD